MNIVFQEMGVEATSCNTFHKPQSRFRIEFPAIVFTAAIEAGDRAFEAPDAGKILAAPGTTIKERAGTLFDWERQGMAARFIGNAEVAAGFAPGRAVRRDASPTRPELGQQMRQLMAQGAIDLGRVVLAQAWIQRDEVAA